jgi:hypothetical protein
MPIYEKPVWQLMWDMVEDLNLSQGEILTKDRVLTWFAEKYPKIKKATITAHLIRMSTNASSRIHYGGKPGDDDLFFQIDGSHFRLYEAERDPQPIYEISEEDVEIDQGDLDEPSPVEFAYEADLRNFLSKNLHLIEPSLSLYEEEGVKGIEFPAGGRFIDILAVSNDDDFVVIELKVSRGYDRVVGQLLRYIGWIRENLAEGGQKVRGVIVARSISDDLLLACGGLTDVNLFEYELSVQLSQVS